MNPKGFNQRNGRKTIIFMVVFQPQGSSEVKAQPKFPDILPDQGAARNGLFEKDRGTAHLAKDSCFRRKRFPRRFPWDIWDVSLKGHVQSARMLQFQMKGPKIQMLIISFIP